MYQIIYKPLFADDHLFCFIFYFISSKILAGCLGYQKMKKENTEEIFEVIMAKIFPKLKTYTKYKSKELRKCPGE